MTKFNKKIFNEMMSAESYTYQNEIFYLERWTKSLAQEVDRLELTLKQVNHIELSLSREIKARDFEGVKAEVTTAIAELYAEAGKELAKRFKNGAM